MGATTGRLNGTFGQLDWKPIHYTNRGLPKTQIAGLCRRANVGLITPLADCMNFLADEYIAAQDPDDPGMLILSHFAGAAEQMQAALRVNPYNTDEVAAAINTALTMPQAERRDRQAELMAGLRREDIGRWAEAFLGALPGSEVLAA